MKLELREALRIASLTSSRSTLDGICYSTHSGLCIPGTACSTAQQARAQYGMNTTVKPLNTETLLPCTLHEALISAARTRPVGSSAGTAIDLHRSDLSQIETTGQLAPLVRALNEAQERYRDDINLLASLRGVEDLDTESARRCRTYLDHAFKYDMPDADIPEGTHPVRYAGFLPLPVLMGEVQDASGGPKRYVKIASSLVLTVCLASSLPQGSMAPMARLILPDGSVASILAEYGGTVSRAHTLLTALGSEQGGVEGKAVWCDEIDCMSRVTPGLKVYLDRGPAGGGVICLDRDATEDWGCEDEEHEGGGGWGQPTLDWDADAAGGIIVTIQPL